VGAEPTGEIIAGYEVTGELGKGTAGRVVRARQKTLNRVVALKLLDPRVARDKATLERFLREARALAPLRHPNVASLIDVGQDPQTGQHFIAFELVEGPSVEQLLTEKKRLPQEEALRIALGVAEGLTCSEQHRVVHRDVQPANILLAPDGTPKLIDMGLAKRLDESGSITVGGLITTPHYVSPEQAMELDSLDVRADLYALGITLFRMVTGRLPFEGDGFLEVVTRHINEDVPDPRTVSKRVSDEVAAIIVGLCARDRESRYPTARAAANDIQRVIDGTAPLGPERAGEAVVRAAPSSDAGGEDDGGPQAESGVGGASELLKGVPFRVVVTSPDGPPIERTFDQPVVTIGRDPSCDLHINDKTVSRRHAELLRNGPTFALSARETANGTFVNEKLVKELVLLAPTDELRIAEKYRLSVTALGKAEESGGWERGDEAPAARPRETFVQDPDDDEDYSRRQAAGEEVGRGTSGRSAGQKTPSSTGRPPGAKTPASTNRPGPPSSPATVAATKKPPSSVSVPATKIPKPKTPPQTSRPPADDEDDPYAPRPAAKGPKPVADEVDPYAPTPLPTQLPPRSAAADKVHEEEEGETLSPFARRAPKSDPKGPPKTEAKAAPKPEPKPAPKPEAPKAEVKPTPKPEAPKAEVKPAPKPEPKPAPKPEAPSTDPHGKGRAQGPTMRVDPAQAREAAQRDAAAREAATSNEPRTEVALRADLGLPPAVKHPPRSEPAPADDTTTPFLRVERKGGPSGPEALVFHAQGQRKRVPLSASFVVGRGPGCDLVLRHPHAPRAAALVVRAADGATLFNVAPSPVIVTVNGAPVAGEHRLAHGDAIEVYGAQLTFEAR